MPRKPIRSRLIAIGLAITGIALPISTFVASVVWNINWNELGDWGGLVFGTLAIFLPMAMLVLSRLLYRVSATKTSKTDQRAPVVYLRRFNEEYIPSPGIIRLDAPNKATFLFALAVLMFVLINFAVLAAMRAASVDDILIYCTFAFMIIVYGAYVIIRLLIGPESFFSRSNKITCFATTLEYELAHHFRRVGPFVAIGEPGEWFAPAGADRLYLDDEDWQKHAISLIENAAVVVLQPASDGATWWKSAM